MESDTSARVGSGQGLGAGAQPAGIGDGAQARGLGAPGAPARAGGDEQLPFDRADAGTQPAARRTRDASRQATGAMTAGRQGTASAATGAVATAGRTRAAAAR